MWSRLSHPISSSHTIWSVLKNCMSAMNWPCKTLIFVGPLVEFSFCSCHVCIIFYTQSRGKSVCQWYHKVSGMPHPSRDSGFPAIGQQGATPDSMKTSLWRFYLPFPDPTLLFAENNYTHCILCQLQFCATFLNVKFIPTSCQIILWRRSIE